MANIQSQIKRNRQNEQRRLRNRDFRGAARTAVRDALASMTSGQETSASVMAAISALDKAAQKGAIHRRNAARRKSRLLKRLAALQAGGHLAMPPIPAKAERGAASAQMPAAKGKKPEAAEVTKTKAETKKAAAKPAEKKVVAKKTAAKKTTKK